MTTNRRFFTEEFKREAVALLESRGRPLERKRRLWAALREQWTAC